MIALLGPDYSLACKTTGRCRVMGCDNEIDFFAQHEVCGYLDNLSVIGR